MLRMTMMIYNLEWNYNYKYTNILFCIGSKRGGQATKESYDRAFELAVQGKLDEIDSDILLRYYSALRKIQFDFRAPAVNLDPISDSVKHAEWWYGPTGTGKSRASRTQYPDAYLKAANTKWWCGYNGQDVVLIEDFDKDHAYMGYHLKIWCDMYTFLAEVKGQQNGVPIRPKKIIITSNYHPREIWTDPSTYEPIERRCKITRFLKFADSLAANSESVRFDAHDPSSDGMFPALSPLPTVEGFTLYKPNSD